MDWKKLKNVAVKEKLKWQPHARHMQQSIALEEKSPPGIYSAIIYGIAGMIGLLLVWSSVTYVDEVARSSGEIVPTQNIQAIQHLEGGIVSQIYVKDGEIVKKGQPLLRLAPTDTLSKLEQIRARRATNMLSIDRNRAIAQGVEPDFEKTIAGYPNLKTDQLALFHTEVQSNALQQSVLEQQLDQQDGEVEKLENQTLSQRQEVKLLINERTLRRELFAKGLTTRESVFALERQAGQGETRLKELEDSLAVARDSVVEAQSRVSEFHSGVRTTALTVIGGLVAQLAETNEALKSFEDKAARLNMLAPVDGIVKGLSVKAINAVVQPGQTLLEMVPTTGDLLVEARISTQDIGHVSMGQNVDVRVTTYDFSTYGSLDGTLETISAATFQSEDGVPYYKATISLPKAFFGGDPKQNRLLPGMVVQANIIVGSKSILDYMMKPIYRGFSNSFQER